MKIVAVDWGRKRTGLAVSSPDGTYALGLPPHIGRPDPDAIAGRVRKEKPDEVVVGLPLNLDGTEGDAALAAREFAGELEPRVGCPVVLWDERLTSEAARAMIKHVDLSRKKKRVLVNTVSAQVILESYMKEKVQSPKSEVQSPKSEVQSPESEVQSPESKVRSPESGNPQSAIRNPQWEVRSPKPQGPEEGA